MAENAQPIGRAAPRAAPARTNRRAVTGPLPATPLGPEGGCSPALSQSASGRRRRRQLRLPEALPVRRSVCHAVSQSRCQPAARGILRPVRPPITTVSQSSPHFNPKQTVTPKMGPSPRTAAQPVPRLKSDNGSVTTDDCLVRPRPPRPADSHCLPVNSGTHSSLGPAASLSRQPDGANSYTVSQPVTASGGPFCTQPVKQPVSPCTLAPGAAPKAPGETVSQPPAVASGGP